jgi:hypothetical protein
MQRQWTEHELARAERERMEITGRKAPVKRQHTSRSARPRAVDKPIYTVPDEESGGDFVHRPKRLGPDRVGTGRLVTIRPEYRTSAKRRSFFQTVEKIGLDYAVIESAGHDDYHNGETGEQREWAVLVPAVILVQGAIEKIERLARHPAVASVTHVMSVRVGMRASGSGELSARHKREFRPMPRAERESLPLRAENDRVLARQETRDVKRASEEAARSSQNGGRAKTAGQLAYQEWAEDGPADDIESRERDTMELVSLQKLGYDNLTPEQWARAAQLLARLGL